MYLYRSPEPAVNRFQTQSFFCLNIASKEVKDRKKIGHLGTRAVFAISVIGGLHLVAAEKAGSGQLEILGAGSHAAVARHIAERQHESVVFDSLEKSEYCSLEHFIDLIPAYEEVTAQLRKAQGL
jgi:hypothetical protein